MSVDLSKFEHLPPNLSCNPNRRRVMKYASALLGLTVDCPESVLK